MDEIARTLGQVALTAIADAIRAGRSRAEAIDAAAAAIRREDVVSDELWRDLERYVEDTRDFEENGA